MGSLVERLKRARGENGFKSTGFFFKIEKFCLFSGREHSDKISSFKAWGEGDKKFRGVSSYF